MSSPLKLRDYNEILQALLSTEFETWLRYIFTAHGKQVKHCSGIESVGNASVGRKYKQITTAQQSERERERERERVI